MQLTYTAGFGGGASSALILMRPDEAPINMFTYRIDVIWTVVWWISNYFPYNIPGRIIRLPPVMLVCKLLLVIASGSIMCTRVDQVLKFHPDATIAALLVGALPHLRHLAHSSTLFQLHPGHQQPFRAEQNVALAHHPSSRLDDNPVDPHLRHGSTAPAKALCSPARDCWYARSWVLGARVVSGSC